MCVYTGIYATQALFRRDVTLACDWQAAIHSAACRPMLRNASAYPPFPEALKVRTFQSEYNFVDLRKIQCVIISLASIRESATRDWIMI